MLVAAGDRVVYAGRGSGLDVPTGPDTVEIDAGGAAVIPGFVDAHTHLIWLGDRSDEYAARAEGASYEEVAARGGGIRSTVAATAAGSLGDLVDAARERARRMLRLGTTTVEVKSGYGQTLAAELRQLEAARSLGREPGLPDVVTTYLPLHGLAGLRPRCIPGGGAPGGIARCRSAGAVRGLLLRDRRLERPRVRAAAHRRAGRRAGREGPRRAAQPFRRGRPGRAGGGRLRRPPGASERCRPPCAGGHGSDRGAAPRGRAGPGRAAAAGPAPGGGRGAGRAGHRLQPGHLLVRVDAAHGVPGGGDRRSHPGRGVAGRDRRRRRSPRAHRPGPAPPRPALRRPGAGEPPLARRRLPPRCRPGGSGDRSEAASSRPGEAHPGRTSQPRRLRRRGMPGVRVGR